MNKFITLLIFSLAIFAEFSETNNLNYYSINQKTDKLIQIDIKHNNEIEDLIQKGIYIISNFDDLIIARCNYQAINILNLLGFNYSILDDINPNHAYYYIWAIDDEAEKAISHFCDVLYQKKEFFIVKLAEINLEKLIRLRVELAKITFDPITVTQTAIKFPQVNYNPLIQEIVDRVNLDSVLSFVQRLVSFQTRYSSTDSCRAAADYIKNQFEIYGLDSVCQQTFRPDYASNIIGIKHGTVYPDSIYIVICGHFDCTSQNPSIFAPGADDNGSGATAVIEATRVMQEYAFEHSIRFIAFSGEEQGLLGSNYYANQANILGDSIIGVINVDMIAFAQTNRDSASIIGNPSNPNCVPLVDYFITCADTYTHLKTQRQIINRPRSDHASFNQFGYQAIHCRENLNVSNPYYHTTGDTIGGGFNNLEFCGEVIKASVATVASLANPQMVGLSDINYRTKLAETKIKIFPNPSFKVIWIISNLDKADQTKLKIYNIHGKIVTSFYNIANSKIMRLDISNLSSGIYFVELTNGRKTATSKIIIR